MSTFVKDDCFCSISIDFQTPFVTLFIQARFCLKNWWLSDTNTKSSIHIINLLFVC